MGYNCTASGAIEIRPRLSDKMVAMFNGNGSVVEADDEELFDRILTARLDNPMELEQEEYATILKFEDDEERASEVVPYVDQMREALQSLAGPGLHYCGTITWQGEDEGDSGRVTIAHDGTRTLGGDNFDALPGSAEQLTWLRDTVALAYLDRSAADDPAAQPAIEAREYYLDKIEESLLFATTNDCHPCYVWFMDDTWQISDPGRELAERQGLDLDDPRTIAFLRSEMTKVEEVR